MSAPDKELDARAGREAYGKKGMKTVVVFGSTGMLGNYVTRFFRSKEEYQVATINRITYNVETGDQEKLFELLDAIITSKQSSNETTTTIINCVGAIPQKTEKEDFQKSIQLNTVFPIQLSHYCLLRPNVKLIHISTDCVFSGSKGLYTENDLPDAKTLYGVSKALAEKNIENNASILRTSIIGEETRCKKSLLEWVLSNNGGQVRGFTNHLWNGVTCWQLAKILETIVRHDMHWKGIQHVFSPAVVSKSELIHLICKAYQLNIQVVEDQSQQPKNLSLASVNSVFAKAIPELEQQIAEMRGLLKFPFVERQLCRFCDSEVEDVVHLGNKTPLAGGFLRGMEEMKEEKTFPLTLSFCKSCQYIQCKQVIEANTLFQQRYFYYSSMIPMLVAHFQEFAKELAGRYSSRSQVLIVEMGCNDGVFLRPLQQQGFKVIGVDPSDTVQQLIADGFTIYNRYFDEEVVDDISRRFGKCDLFLSSNSFAHVDDMKTVMKCVKKILKSDGLLIVEVHYSPVIFDELQFDFIYHEHMSYYTVTSLSNICRQYGFFLEKVKFTKIHGKSLRVYIRNEEEQTRKREKDQEEEQTRKREKDQEEITAIIEKEAHLTKFSTYCRFMTALYGWKTEIVQLFKKLKEGKKKIYGYGSSGRANMICSFCGFDLDEIIDDAPSKIGSFTPVFHKKICSSSILQTDPPDFVLILSWPYASHIIAKNSAYLENGGKFIIPLPKITIV